MANRVPLTSNKELKRIEELPVGDYLDLSQSGIVNADSIQSKTFYGDLVGIASTAIYLTDGANILAGTISSERLTGAYDIDITGKARSLERAENILDGVINPARLTGSYDIDITGTARNLETAENILAGTISSERLTGTYGINITGTSETVSIKDTNANAVYYPTFTPNVGAQNLDIDLDRSLSYNPSTKRLGINTNNPTKTLDVRGDVIAEKYYGDGVNLVGIVTQIIPSIGINIKATQNPGKGVVTIDSYRPVGKTIYVSQTGDDDNTGLTENYPKRTIKSAASIALFGDTIKVYPGVYVEKNPIFLSKTVSVQGTELRNIVITPKYPELDLFYVNNGCHITNASFIGPEMKNGSAIISLQPLLGVSTDRFFDAARMIRMNLDYIASESVGFLTSGFSGFAGGHREQDAANLIDSNLNYIAAEAVGFLTTPVGSSGYGFTLSNGDYTNCKEDVVSVFSAVSYDLKANSNRKSVGAALSYFNSSGGLIHITGIATQQATIAAFNYAVGIAKSVINNVSPPKSYQSGIGSISQTFNPSVILVAGGCVGVGSTISQLVGIVTSAIGAASTLGLPAIKYGVRLESNDCADDIKDIWKCIIHDITRGGNSRSYQAGSAYYDRNWNLLPGILKNPEEVNQTIKTVEYSFNIARAAVNNSSWGGYPVGVATNVTNALYNNVTGIVTITAQNHGLILNDPVKIVGLGFTCPSGPATLTYPTGKYGYIFPVKSVINSNTFEAVVGISTLPHTYVSGTGTVQKYRNFQSTHSQIKDLSIQADPQTGFNNSINSCSDVISALYSCVGVVTTIVGLGRTSGITRRFPGNSGIGFTSLVGITSAIYYDSTDTVNPLLSGFVKVKCPGLNVKAGDRIELRELLFECNSSGSGISTQFFPSGKYGYEFYVDKLNSDSSFNVFVGISTIPHKYVSGGFIVNRSIGVTTAVYNNTTGITTITAPGVYTKVGDVVRIRDLKFSCLSGAETTTIYPTGSQGYEFKVISVPSLGNSFTVQVGTSTIPHTYVSGGVVFPPYSKGVGPITQGPYVRNCTNFIPKSIGMKVDGFAAEPGDQDDIGVTGTMSVDSYTQYNQGGIGVSITNGGYAQLVSIFTICDDIAIYTGTGGQCDLTNSNSSFGNYGLYSSGVGDNKSKSIYRFTGQVKNTVNLEDIRNDRITIANIGNTRPYDGQAIYFDKLYYKVDSIQVTNGGSGYSEESPPEVIIDVPTGPSGIKAEASANVINGRVVSVDIISTGNQYESPPNISFSSGVGVGASATAVAAPLYYNIETATKPVNGESTIVLTTPLNNTVTAGTTVYFFRLSLQIATTISFEWVGAGTDINTAKPALGGVTISDNEVVKELGGQVIYTSTNQAGNFKIGDDVVINQLTGTISGRAYNQSVLSTVTPLIIALG
jgi:hypothetical protein